MPELAAIALAPLAGFLLNGLLATRLFAHRRGHRFVTLVGCGLPIAAFALTLKAFADLAAGGYAPLSQTLYTWIAIGGVPFEVSFWFDRLTAVMALIVTGVGSLIHVYSVGYMKDDESYARYFAYLNLFLFFMLLLVLGRSLLVLFVGWEGVGLASYLLIGFWFSDPEKAAAGKKAFVVNRIGDAGFLLGMFVLYATLGTLDMDRINAAFLASPGPAVSATLVGILLFVGATGKSAQIPLYVWLPDAMAGPTPVSALIHAATMVTAGVYMVARLSGIYVNAEGASQLVAWIGVLTAFFAATIAVAQHDIKKVLAYSTVSQLGFMFLAAGVGAYGVAVFHLYTHAFFKACLFLGAGSVIHALSGEQDIRKMGGLARRIPVTFATFAVATAAIAGLPPLSGFFSKDEILWFAYASERGGSPWLFAIAALTALMTAFYMFRLLWLVFLGRSRLDHHAAAHVHESPPSMTGVLVVLAILSAAGGFLSIPHVLEPLLPLPGIVAERAGGHVPIVVLSVALGLAGLAGAWWLFGGAGERAARLDGRAQGLRRLLEGKYFVDEFYERLVGRPLVWVSEHVFLRLGDRAVIDGTLHGLAGLAQRTAALMGRVQTGHLHFYAFLALAGLVGALAWSWRHG
ncbi:MAG: NADH-quinone oxidoreductase subunit L [Burkholderiales bacterium]|nr:NADH-quinone oxidoreductase subunit L [Burkholderiales bacterium]GIK87428.1 MAG: NADH-quinone oxidoreductase subunit L [Betaproteobacteria bacterium]